MKKLVFILVFVFAGIVLYSQDTIGYVCAIKVIDGDTLIVSGIEEVYIFPPHKFKNAREARRYRRLIRNVKKAYPYAKLAAKKLAEVNDKMLTITTKNEKNEYLKQVEQEIKDEFEEKLKKLTITQGKILVKLIDRETGDTSYALVKELKGSFSAFFWQALARLFGNDLKAEYDPYGEDRLIEEIVLLIESGQL